MPEELETAFHLCPFTFPLCRTVVGPATRWATSQRMSARNGSTDRDLRTGVPWAPDPRGGFNNAGETPPPSAEIV